jgi:hypothetical protein
MAFRSEDVQEKLGMPLSMGGAVGAAGTSPSRGRVSNRGPADEDLRWHAASLAAAAAAADQRSWSLDLFGWNLRSCEVCKHEETSLKCGS